MPAISIYVTVPPIEILEFTKDGRIHIVSNTGQALNKTFEIDGKTYALANCELPEHKYIDTICDIVVKVSGSTE